MPAFRQTANNDGAKENKIKEHSAIACRLQAKKETFPVEYDVVSARQWKLIPACVNGNADLDIFGMKLAPLG